MLEKFDKVAIIGSAQVPDFTEGLIVNEQFPGVFLVNVNNNILFMDEFRLFLKGSISHNIMKLLKFRSYMKYKKSRKHF